MAPNIMGDWTPDEKREHALNQIQTIAYDGVLLAERTARQPETDPLVRSLVAKIERIVNIAEAQEPDEDWEPAMIDRAS